MNTLYIDCRMGVSGIKLMGALVDLLESPELFVRRFNEIGFPGVRLEREIEAAKGVSGSLLKFRRTDVDERDMYADEIDAEDTEAIKEIMARQSKVHVRRLNEVTSMIDDLPLSGKLRKRAITIYEDRAKAAADVSGRNIEDVKMNRTGSRDVIAAVVGVCMLIEELEFERIVASPVATGTGFAMTSRGRMPIPIPALQNLLKDIPFLAGTEEGELCTLEGAAILKEIVHSFEEMPELTVLRTGAGFGQRTFKDGINCVRTYVGNVINSAANKTVTELEAFLSSDNSASIKVVCDKLKADGAYEAYTLPAFGQEGFLVKCVCENETADIFAGEILRCTSAKQVRRHSVATYMPECDVQEVSTSLGSVRVEHISGFGKNIKTPKPEDVAKIASESDMSYNEVMYKVLKELEENE